MGNARFVFLHDFDLPEPAGGETPGGDSFVVAAAVYGGTGTADASSEHEFDGRGEGGGAVLLPVDMSGDEESSVGPVLVGASRILVHGCDSVLFGKCGGGALFRPPVSEDA